MRGDGIGGSWAKRDAAVVWHGFTQMSCYTEAAPVVVVAGDGHELIDVDGRRYLDAISSLWVNTLGHHVPELDDAVRAQLDRGAHSTMLGNGNEVVVELAEALATRVPVDDPHFLFASDGASAVEQALKIAFQYWANRGVEGRTRFLALGGAYHGDTIGALSVGDGGFGTDLFDPLRFPVLRAPGFDDPHWGHQAARMVREHASGLAAVIVEPLVQGAAGMRLADPAAFDVLGEACATHDVLLICDEVATGFGRTGTLFASEQCGLRPDLLVLGKGLTAGYLPQSATVARGRVFDAFLGPDLSTKTLYHGHSYGGNALACAVALRQLELFDRDDILANVRDRSAELRHRLTERIAPLPAVREVRLHGLMGGVELAAPDPGRRWGRRVCWDRWARDEAARIRDAGQWRQPHDLDSAGPEGKLVDSGRPVVSFASNDYLGLTQHPTVVDAAHAALDRWGTGSGSARLIVGSRPIHSELEAELAAWKGCEQAVLFPTGFAANLGVLTTFGGPGTLVCSDELNHASIIDGCRLSRAELAVYRHRDVEHLHALLARAQGRPTIVVTDTVFSMDGDVAPVTELVEACRRAGSLLLLDEAHAVLEPDPVLEGVDAIRIGTLSKTLGALGGFVAGTTALCQLLVNRARSYIFTTASTPADTAAARAALGIVRSAAGDDLRRRLRANIERVRPRHPSPVVPVVLGDEARTLAAATALLDLGLLVPAIRPPTVPAGTARLRVALSAMHSPSQVDRLVDALATL